MTQPVLRFPTSQPVPRSLAPPPETLGLAIRLAAVLIIGAAFVFTAGIITGKRLERGSELGQVLAYGPRLAAIDSVLDSSRAILRRYQPPRPRTTTASQ